MNDKERAATFMEQHLLPDIQAASCKAEGGGGVHPPLVNSAGPWSSVLKPDIRLRVLLYRATRHQQGDSMGLFDKLTGTKHPDDGVPPRSAVEIRAALLALNAPDMPWAVRDAVPEERADLVAEWRVLEPALRMFFRRNQLDRTLKTRMRLIPENHEVRALDEQWQLTWVGDTPRLARSREYSRGQVSMVSRHWVVERGADGHLRKTEIFRFDPAEMKIPLQNVVLGAGWTWRGVVFKL